MKITKIAADLGRQAFKAGLRCVPAADQTLLDLIRQNKGRSVLLAKAWQKGWIDENFAAPVPGWTDDENRALLEYQKNYWADKAEQDRLARAKYGKLRYGV
ncbi:MAG: hypothetical protein Pg6C_17240 [Treponemataceae bacterium]|nr:MAG: hypothetical protein Pg6C_17240 [Treponemataceae bacterium]